MDLFEKDIEATKRVSRFLRGVTADLPPVLVLGVSANGLSFVRSLGRKGIPVVAIDSVLLPGMYSRYCKRVILPDVIDNERTWTDFLRAVGESLPCKGVIIPTSDAHVLFLSRNRSDLCSYFGFALAEEEVLEKITNKRLQYEFAESCGIPIPRTYSPQDIREIDSVVDTFNYPCLLKPYQSHLWRKYAENKEKYGGKKLAVVNTPEELLRTYGEMAKSGVGIMVQERIPGGDDQFYGLLTYFNENSEPLAIFTKRKLRQTGMGYGDGSFQVSIWEPTVAELGIRLLRSMKYRGLAGIEFKKDPRDGQFKLIEVNPRSVTAEGMAVKSGVDIPYIAYLDIIGRKVDVSSSFSEGLKWVSLEWDFKTFLAYKRHRMLSFTQWIRSLRGKRDYAIWSRDDPLPFMVMLSRMFRAALRKISYSVGVGKRRWEE